MGDRTCVSLALTPAAGRDPRRHCCIATAGASLTTTTPLAAPVTLLDPVGLVAERVLPPDGLESLTRFAACRDMVDDPLGIVFSNPAADCGLFGGAHAPGLVNELGGDGREFGDPLTNEYPVRILIE